MADARNRVLRKLRSGARGWTPVVVAALLIIGVPAAIVVAIIAYRQSGVTETALQPQEVRLSATGSDPHSIAVGATWMQDGWCIGQFQAQATESTREVRLGPVISRDYPHGSCAGVGTVYNMAWADLTLKAPLGARAVIRASDGAVLPVYGPDDLLVRKGPTSADIEHYGGRNDNPPLALRKSIRVTDPNALGQLVQELNPLPPFPTPFPRDLLPCPMNDGSYYLIDLHYLAGGDATIKVDATGCQAVYLGETKQAAAWAANAPGLFTLLGGLLGE
jgi:hypothetical protein